MKQGRILAALLALIVAFAGRADTASWEGHFELASAGDNIDTAIETAVAPMNFIKRPIARSRLKKTNPPYQRISITRNASQISIAFDARKPVIAPADGSAAKWTREDGEVFDVAVQARPDALVQTFKAEDGQRTNTFEINANGELSMKVAIASGQLPAPLTYTLLYRRKD